MEMTNRGKILITAVLMLFVIVLAYPVIITPLKKDIKLLDRKIGSKTKNLDELSTLKQEYKVISEKLKTMESRVTSSSSNVTLPSLLERVAGRTNLKSNMTGLRVHETVKTRNFQEDGVEISLKDITVDELIKFVYSLETLPYTVKVKGFAIKTTYGKEPKLMKLTLLVSLFTPN